MGCILVTAGTCTALIVGTAIASGVVAGTAEYQRSGNVGYALWEESKELALGLLPVANKIPGMKNLSTRVVDWGVDLLSSSPKLNSIVSNGISFVSKNTNLSLGGLNKTWLTNKGLSLLKSTMPYSAGGVLSKGWTAYSSVAAKNNAISFGFSTGWKYVSNGGCIYCSSK